MRVIRRAIITACFVLTSLALSGFFTRSEVRVERVSVPAPEVSIEEYIDRQALAYDLNPRFVRAVITIESRWNPAAVSAVGAAGLMQLMPANAKACGLSKLDKFDPKKNADCGMRWLRYALDNHGGDKMLALREYNGGPKCVPGGCKESEKHWRDVFLVLAQDVPATTEY